MEKEKPIDVLNTLVEINYDRIEGYKTASKNTGKIKLQNLFSEFIQTSLRCRHELISEICKLDGKAVDGTNETGKFFRAWMDVKSALTGKDWEAILNSCEYGEKQADETYQTILDDQSEHLNPQQQSMIKAQHNLLKADQSKIKSMQHTLVEASQINTNKKDALPYASNTTSQKQIQ